MLLDQYELAAGHRMPDDLTVSTVLRCLDGATCRHLEMIMDEGMEYSALKDKLILLDKNTKAWSGDNFLKNLQVLQPAYIELFYLTKDLRRWKWIRCNMGTKGRAKERGNRKERREAGLVFHTVANLEGTRRIQGQIKTKGQERRQRKEQRKASKGKGYGGGNNSNTCRLCGEYGHWGHECPLRNRGEPGCWFWQCFC